jgi:tetratricopeptide (TPR) repeat protein
MATRIGRLDNLAFTLALVLTAGCAGSLHTQGKSALDRGDAQEARRLLEIASRQRPEDGVRHRDLGLACFQLSDLQCARSELEEADRLGAMDGEGLECLGLACAAARDTARAIRTFARYPEVSFLSPHRRAMVSHLRDLVRSNLTTRDIVSDTDVSPNTVAVVRLSSNVQTKSLEPLSAGMTEWLVGDLYCVDDLTVLERLRIDAVLRELQLAGSEEVDPASAPRLGELLGARRLVTGALTELPNERLRIDLYAFDTRGLEREVRVAAEGRLLDFFMLEKELVFRLLDQLQIPLSPYERAKIERVPTQSLASFLAYSEGLEQLWSGDDAGADAAFREALSIDPGWEATDARDEDAWDSREETADRLDGDGWSTDPVDARLPAPEVDEGIPGPPDVPPPPSGTSRGATLSPGR